MTACANEEPDRSQSPPLSGEGGRPLPPERGRAARVMLRLEDWAPVDRFADQFDDEALHGDEPSGVGCRRQAMVEPASQRGARTVVCPPPY